MESEYNLAYKSILPVLGIIFITLKLCGVISWSWWWVLSPFWIGWVILLVLVAVAGIFFGFVSILEYIGKTK